MNDNRRKLYDALSQDYDLGTYEQFASDIADANKRKKLYDATVEEYDYGDFSAFEAQLGFAPAAPRAPKAEDINPTTKGGENGFTFTANELGLEEEPKKKSRVRQKWEAQKAERNKEDEDGTAEFNLTDEDREQMAQRLQEKMNPLMSKPQNASPNLEYGSKVADINAPTEEEVQAALPAADKKLSEQMQKGMTTTGAFDKAYQTTRKTVLLEDERKRLEDERNKVRERAANRRESITTNAGTYQYGMAPITGNAATEINDLELSKLAATEKQLDQAIREVDRKLSGEDVGFWQGFADATIRNPGFYTFGLSDMNDARALLNISENGVNSDTDRALLDATYTNSLLQADADRGFMYRAGNQLGHSLPFMIQMAVTGGGSGISNLGSKAAQKYATQTIKHRIARATGVLADDLLESAFIVNTAGAGSTQAKILQNKTGQLKKDAEGNYHFEGKEGWLEAAYKGEVSAILEMYTEKLGGHLDGKLSITKGLESIGASWLSKALTHASKSDIGKAANAIFSQFGINGVLPEVMEEEANIILNSIFVGDNKLSDLFDLQTQIDIVGGMFLSVGTMRAIPGTIGSAGYMYNQRLLNRADKEAEAAFGEKWPEMRERLNDATNENVAGVVYSMTDGENANVLLDYYKRMMIMRGYNIGTTKKDEVIPSAETAYQEGYEAADEQKSAVKQAYDMGRERALSTFGEEVVQLLDDDPISTLAAMNEVDRAEAIDYVNAKTAYEGMIDRINADIDERIAASDKEIDSHKNKQDGAIHPAMMRGVNGTAPKRVYIVNGNVATFEDGTIDKANSSSMIIVRDAETGEVSAASADDLESLDAVIDTEAEKKTVAEQIANEYAEKQADIIVTDSEWQEDLSTDNGEVTAEEVAQTQPSPIAQAPKTALEQIPRDEKNVPLYEQVDSELAWDGVVEEAGGNEETAMVAVNSMVEDKKKALAAAEKAKAKAGVTIAEKIAAENERVANIEKAKADLAKWEEIAGVKAKRAAAQAENVAQPVAETAPVESAPVVEEAQPALTEGENNADSALQNGDNELNLQKENESYNESNQNDIPVGGQVSQSVPQGEHGEVASLSGGVQETAARLRERIESTQGDSKSGLREVENRVTREFAQENGLWIDDMFKLGVPFPSGDEHINYIDAENQVIYKVNNRMHTPSILGLLDRLELHNKYFPNTQYRLVGFTSVSENGDVMPVFAQDFVLNAHMATVDEIDSYMGTLGFTRVGDGRYSNGEVVVKDLKPRNVLVDPNGDVYVVDAEFENPAETGGSEIPNGSTVSQASEQVIDHYTLNSAGNSTQMQKDMEALRKSNRDEYSKIQPAYELLKQAKERGLYPNELEELRAIVKGTSLESKVDGWFTPVMAEGEPVGQSGVEIVNPKPAAGPKQVNVESLMGALRQNGEAKLSDHVEQTNNPSGNKLVTDERYNELKERMKKKLKGQMNIGVDPEILAIGTEMAVYHIEKGARKFADFAKGMIADLGDAIRPYLKAFYNGARELPEIEEAGFTKDMTPYEEVKTFDVANFDKQAVDAMATAETVTREAEVAKDVEAVKAPKKRESAEGKKLRKATQEDLEGNPVVYYNGEKHRILMLVHRGEQTSGARFTKPEITRVYLENMQDVKVDDLYVEDTRENVGESGDNSVPSQQTPVNNLNDNNDGREEITAADNSGAQPGREELPDTEQVGAGVPVQNTARNSKRKRRNAGVGSSELGNGPQYDVNRNYTNEEIEEIVSSVTDIVDGKVVITGEVTDDIKAIVRGYESGGIAKKGRGILDEYYTDGKIVDAVNLLIAPYFNSSTPIRVLEPSVGIGNFIQAVNNIPTSEVVAFEINETTARIAKFLYQDVDVNLRSFETEFIDESGNKKPLPQKYSLVIGNPPYGSHRGLYKGLGEESKIARYEDYFVKRSLDVLDEGGVLAMVLPSSWMDRHTKFGGYTIERAYRLPSGAFEATQVGTDIVILKKDSSVPVSEHVPYFEQFPERVLGEVKQRKGRYGRLEEYVEGDIDAAIEAIKKENAEQVADLLNIEKNNDALNDIESAVDETGSPEKAVAIVKDAQESEKADNKTATKPSGKQGKYKVELSRGAETVQTSAQFTHEFSEGEVEAFADTDYEGALSNPSKHRRYANYIGGQAIHDFYYAEGDIYSKLAQLEQEKDYIVENYGAEQYEKQKTLLESVLPKQKSLEEITISPNTTFVKNLNILTEGGRVSLKDVFVDFLRKLPRQAFGNSSPWEVVGYINNEQVHGTNKQRNQLIRERRKRVANDLFNKFLSEELSDNAKKQVVAAFNREYNSTYRPDYSKVPMFSTINRDFKGKPLRLTSVQLAGIGRMTVKGVGVLAHEVGFGKTLSGILAMHEAMTRGFAEKPLIVVPNDNILKQWVETIGEVLPNATVNTLGNLGAGYDLTGFKVNAGEFTIITYEGLKAMSFSDYTYNHLADKFSYITEDLNKHQSERDIQKEIEKKKELKGKMKRGTKPTYLFEDFGFDWLTVDEVHNANHIVSKVRLDKSVASDFRSQSQRTSDLGLKTWLAAQYIQEENNGRNVLLLSATPFTNKPLEYYSILSLVGNDMLERKGFFNVDQFFATFMEADNELEIGANGRPTQKTNVRRFRNNGLFQQLLSEFIDIKGEEDNPELVRPERLNKEYKIAQNELTAEAMAAAQELLSDNDTVLQGIGHARAAAFSPYATSLLGMQPKNHKEFVKNSPKIDATIRMIEQNIKDRPDAGQIIYSEVGVEYFPLIRDYLVKESGLKPSEVRIITGATSNNERVNIQTAFNNGDVKVVIGSPAIKEGLNLQGNTTDMYILSLPWNFTQLRQIEGRGWRQGNRWENIRINYMLTNDSVDVFMLQRLQLKQGLYNEAMKSGAESLDVSDIDTAELKTALITDPAVRAEIVTVQERAKLQQEKTQIEADLSFVMRKYEAYNKLVEKLNSQKNTIKMYREWAKKGDEYWAQRIPREEAQLANIENEIEEEKQNLLKKGVNVDDIVRQTEQAQNAIAAIQEKIDNLKEFQEELTQKFREESEAKAKEQGDLVSTYIKERKAENKGGFYRIRPEKTETKAAEEESEDGVLYRGDEDVPRLNKYKVEKIFGGIWIEDKEEFAKFVSAVNNYAFEENGQGVAYTDSNFYAYYLNIDGQVIPYASVKLTAEQSQEVVNQVNQEIENVREGERAQFYFDRAYVRARNAKGKNNADNGNNNGAPSSRSNGGLVRGILRKGAYYDNPGLYVKAQRADRFGFLTPSQIERAGNGEVANSARQRGRMADKARQVAEKLNLDNVEVLESTEGLTGKKATSKGWFDPKTGKITVVVPNHGSTTDVTETVLHEAVAHYGLRKLFGKNFNNFLDNVFNNVTPEIRAEITELAKAHGWDFHTATEEYLASLAENTNFERVNPSVWSNIKSFFMKMLAKVGITLDEPLGDNELRYILWRSHQNLVNPGWFNVFGLAEDIAKQYELGVGNYASEKVETESGEVAAEDDSALLHREGGAPGSARKEYERKVRRPNKSGSVGATENAARRAQEAYQDSMLALKILQDAVAKETGNEVKDNENAYIAENRMSSSNKAMVEIYERDFFMPLMDEINALIKKGVEYDDIIRYLHAKHGLERNEYMRRKQAEEAARRELGEEPAMPNEGDADYEAKVNAKADWRANLAELTESYVKKFAKRDYSGLTALTETANAKAAEAAAQQMVDEFENDHDTTPLWEAVNKATKETLRREFVGGLIDRATYDTVSTMFDFYIPLRGWDENVAANEYEYFANNNTPVFTPAIKTIHGRKSLSDDPIATIGYMAGSAIARANRNLMKQKFLNFVMNNPTSLATVSEQWYTMDYGTNEWVPNNPAIPEDATPEQVVEIVEAHEANMRALEKAGKATRERSGLKIGLHATKQEQQQHVVRVMRNGKEYAVYINGNPRAAQALNGMTNPDVSKSKAREAAQTVKNFMARAFTSRNPAFIISNSVRDVIWAGTAVAAKEDVKYTKQYTKNVTGVLAKFKLPRLLRKFRNGTLDMNNEIERYFDEFLRNGGETGFTQVLTVEDYKKNIARFTKEAKNGTKIPKKAWRGLWNGIEFLNRSAEDITRFTVYMTSRQMGRSIARSVYDAKEITVNFNKKGSGEMGARYLNFAYIFFNATTQSLANFGKLMARHPGKMAAALGTFGMMGFLMPVINAALMALGDDGDEENYWNLPEWVRRNNIVLFVPWAEKGFITIPLPHEIRPFYGMGENAMSALQGKQTTEDAIKKSLVGFTGMLPIDFTANDGDVVVNVMPTILQPLAQVRANITHFGTPIYKDNDFNKRYPSWTKAYKGTNSHLVAATKWLNELGGGNDVDSGGLLDWNPAVIEHLFESYLGGMGKTFNKMATTVSMIWDEEARISRNIPVANSFYQESDERTAGSQLNREYFDALEEKEDFQHRLNGYRKQIMKGNTEYEKLFDDLIDSDEFMRYEITKKYSNAIRKLNNELKNNNPTKEKTQEIEGVIQELKKEMLDELEKLQAEE